MCSQQQLNDAWYCAMFTQWRVIGRTQRQVADEADDGLDQRPLAWRMQQLHKHRQAVVQPHGILGRFRLHVTARQVT